MNFVDYINEVLWGRLGRICVGLVFLFSAILTLLLLIYTPGLSWQLYLLMLVGPSIVYQTVTTLAATALWIATKDWVE